MVTKYIRGVKRQRPPGVRLKTVWDPAPILVKLRNWGPIQSLTFDGLSRRTMLLFLLATGQRLQALYQMRRSDLDWDEVTLRIVYTTRLKTNDPIMSPLRLNFRKHEVEELCVFSHLKAYTEDTRSARASPHVFATCKTPGRRASSATISRMVKSTLTMLGISTDYTAYTARHASTSAAARMSVPLSTIMASAGWSRESTFTRFYDRPLHVPTPEVVTDFIPHIMGE